MAMMYDVGESGTQIITFIFMPVALISSTLISERMDCDRYPLGT